MSSATEMARGKNEKLEGYIFDIIEENYYESLYESLYENHLAGKIIGGDECHN